MPIKRKILDGMSNTLSRILNLEKTIGTHDIDIAALKNFNGISPSSQIIYVAPKYPEHSNTYTTEAKKEKLIGNDTTGNGKIDKPFASLNRAFQELRKVRASAPIQYIIRMHSGTYMQHYTEVLDGTTIKMRWGIAGDENISFSASHFDMATGSRCYYELQGYSWPGHVGNAIDVNTVLVSKEDWRNVENITNQQISEVAVQNPVVWEIYPEAYPSGGYCPFAVYGPIIFRNITFKCFPDFGAYTKMFSQMFPIHQYSGDGMGCYNCKFYNFPAGAFRTFRGTFNGTNVAPYCHQCYFDNEDLYKMAANPDKSGIPSNGLTFQYYSATGAQLYAFRSKFRYASTAIITNICQTYMPPVFRYDVNTGKYEKEYPINVLTFEECARGIQCDQYSSFGEQPGTSSPRNNFLMKFKNNVVDRIYKVRVGTKEYN